MISKILKISLIAMISFSMSLFAKSLSLKQFFEKYSDIDGVTYVAVNPGPSIMSEIADNMDDKNIANMIKGINKLRILTTKNSHRGNNIDIFKDAIESLSLKNYQTFLEVKENKTKVRMLYEPVNDKQIKNFLLLVKERNESTIIWVDGVVDLKDLSKLTGMIGSGFGNKVKIPAKGKEPVEAK